MSKNKERLDVLMAERGMARSRSKAKAMIMTGKVFVDGEKVDKAGTFIAPDADIEFRGDVNPYVSRGGLKLDSALQAFGYDCTDKVVIDVGASTGGFTDCVLQKGAARVYAVDVGYGQLAWKLRQDDRVEVIERTNIRHMQEDRLPEKCDLAVIDCSFISLELVLPNTLTFLKEDADVIALIKPQFEVGKENVGKGGVVRDAETRQRAIDDVVEMAAGLGMHKIASVDSEVHGPAGNVEHLVWLQWGSHPSSSNRS